MKSMTGSIYKKWALMLFTLTAFFLVAEVLLRTFAPIYLVGRLDWFQLRRRAGNPG